MVINQQQHHITVHMVVLKKHHTVCTCATYAHTRWVLHRTSKKMSPLLREGNRRGGEGRGGGGEGRGGEGRRRGGKEEGREEEGRGGGKGRQGAKSMAIKQRMSAQLTPKPHPILMPMPHPHLHTHAAAQPKQCYTGRQ